jgi:XRE family transcriptional regulator, regulator of sulfur utilization
VAIKIGDRIRARRQARQWSQAYLAGRARIHQVTLARIETGVVDPTVSTVMRLAKALGLKTGQLLD